MARKRQFTDQQVIDVLRQYPKIQDAAAALGISRQALLAYRKTPAIVAALGLPAPTPEEQANKERARERKAEIRQQAATWTPSLDDITGWLFKVVEQAGKARRLENQNAILTSQLRDKDREIERLKGRLSLLDKAEQQKREFALAVQQGEITPIRG